MRRTVRFAVPALLLAGLALLFTGAVPCAVMGAQPSCQVVLRPGPSEDTLSLVSVEGTRAYPPVAGELRLTTIAVQDDLRLRPWLAALVSGVEVAVPRETIYPAGLDTDEVTANNAAAMVDSQQVATIVALEALGHTLEGEGARVARVTADAVTDDLEIGDVIVAVDGRPVRESHEVVAAVRARAPGDRVSLQVRSDDGEREVEVELGASPEAPGTAYVGVLLTTEVDLPVDVEIDAGPIGGPSAGLMFALSIVELLEPGDLVDGRVVAGTGTLARDGTVGPVGAVRQKVAGAASSEGQGAASVFLVPRGDLAEARRAPVDNDLLVVPVDDLAGALAALEALATGGRPTDAVLLESS